MPTEIAPPAESVDQAVDLLSRSKRPDPFRPGTRVSRVTEKEKRGQSRMVLT